MQRRSRISLGGRGALLLLAATVPACAQTVVLEEGTDGGATSNDGSSSDAHCIVGAAQALQFKTQSPEVIVALDRSAAMSEQLPTTLAALVPQVQSYQNVIRFGFVDFPDALDTCADSCCVGPLTVPPQMPIGFQSFGEAAYTCNTSGQTCPTSTSRPTEMALKSCVAYYQYEGTQIYGRYVLLITNGDPNGNGEPDGRCGTPKGDCADAEYEVGVLHGLTVQTVIVDLGLQSNASDCLHELATGQGANVIGAPYYYFVGSSGLNDVLSTITGTIAKAACHLALTAPAPDRSQVSISYYGKLIPPDDPNGWSFDQGSSVGITLNGAACQAFIGNPRYPQGLDVTSGCASPHGGPGGL